MSNAELVALVLGSGRPGVSVLAGSRALLATVGGLEGLGRCRPAELLRAPGVGLAKACALCATVELGRRLAGAAAQRGDSLCSSAAAFQRVRGRLAGLSQEVFIVLALDARHRLISITQVAQGSATFVDVHPRDVFAPLVRDGAVAALVAHNHPSGDPEPSRDDHDLTRRLGAAAELLGIPIVDHLIVAGDRYVSLAERGEM